MPWLNKAEVLRNVEWSTSIDWDVRFSDGGGPGAPFTDWFPAIDVEENIATLNNHVIEAYMSSYEFPMGSSIFDLSVTFIDDVKYTVHEWLADWINNGILNYDKGNGPYLTPLADAVREIQLVRLDATREWSRRLRDVTYLVTPDGTLNWQGASSPEVGTNTFRFSIHHTNVGPTP